jgi:transcriptional regulator with XRE-family HTH domain
MAQQSGPPWKEVLAILRVIRHWSPKQLAAAAGLKPRSILGYERTGERTLDRPTLCQLAAAMGFPAGVLDRTAAFVERARVGLEESEPRTREAARQARIARVAAQTGQWYEDVARAGLTAAVAEAAPREPGEEAMPLAALGSTAPPFSDGGAAARLLGEALTILRIVRQMSQTELGAVSGIPRDTISDYERGRFSPSSEALRRLVEAMGLSAAILERALSLMQTVRAVRESSEPVLDDGVLAGQIEEFIGAEAREVEQSSRRRLERLALAARVFASRRQAPALWARFVERLPEEQRRLVSEKPDFQTAGFCELLCDESVKAAGDSPARALHLADLAVRVSELLAGDDGWRRRLAGYARAHLANAVRVPGDFAAAERAFAYAAELWKAGAAEDPGLLNAARVLQIESSLRREQRRLPEALALLDEALAADRWGETTRLLIGKAKALEENGDCEAALALLRQAAARPDARRQPELLLWVHTNLAVNLCRLRRHAEAELMLPEVRAMAARLARQVERVRVAWLEGQVAAGLGRPEQALAVLERVRREFLSRDMVYDAAMATLELAEIHASLGHTSRVKALARESAPVFQHRGVHREAQAALECFCAAAEAERLSLELVRGVIAYLYRARHGPQLRFEPPA